MNKSQLSRRHFNTLCATVGLWFPIGGNIASVLAADASPRTVKFRSSVIVPAVGQGSARLGQGRHPEAAEEEALRTGISLGMSLIDTSGDYGNGRSEKLIGYAISGQRDRVFLVSKVEANEVSGDGMARACQASLSRLGADVLDLYLLHWPVPNSQFSDVVRGFEQLRSAGKIKAWGVSNFDVDQMEALFRIPDGNRCATNQVPYSLNNRGIERDLLSWCTQHDLPVMAYSPLGGENSRLITDHTLAQIGAAHGCSAAAIAARPVGAQSRRLIPFAARIPRIALTIVVLPTPGPPVMTRASRIAAIWLSARARPIRFSTHGRALSGSIQGHGSVPFAGRARCSAIVRSAR
jgi:diketogulonate reductase-like aldo/keto reductase